MVRSAFTTGTESTETDYLCELCVSVEEHCAT